jgi:uncharacterized UPF0160 family protein
MSSLSDGKYSYTTKLSSAGLVYLHFGRDIIAEILQEKDAKILDILYKSMYENFVEEIDAVDNGVSQHEDSEARCVPEYDCVF